MRKKQSLRLVKFVLSSGNKLEHKYPFQHNKVYVFLGELANMPGHCVVAEYPSGGIFAGYHIDNFVDLKEDEV